MDIPCKTSGKWFALIVCGKSMTVKTASMHYLLRSNIVFCYKSSHNVGNSQTVTIKGDFVLVRWHLKTDLWYGPRGRRLRVFKDVDSFQPGLLHNLLCSYGICNQERDDSWTLHQLHVHLRRSEAMLRHSRAIPRWMSSPSNPQPFV